MQHLLPLLSDRFPPFNFNSSNYPSQTTLALLSLYALLDFNLMHCMGHIQLPLLQSAQHVNTYSAAQAWWYIASNCSNIDGNQHQTPGIRHILDSK